MIKYAFTSQTTNLTEVRRIVDWQVTNRLLAVEGVTQVVVFGGDVRQHQLLVTPEKLKAFNVSLQNVTAAVAAANVNAPGGYLITPEREKLIRGIGRIENLEDLKQSVITAGNWLGQGLNTMTLGGLAVAIGSAVDDAIVDAENVYRCLRENKYSPNPRPVLDVEIEGCQEVRDSVFGATIITVVVFSPVFALTGVEGSIFIPMGLGYLVAVLASSVIALTVTPALCAILLPYGRLPEREPWVARFFKRLYHPLLIFSIRHSSLILIIATTGLVAAAIIVPSFGRIFLPEFQERSQSINCMR